MYVVYKERVRHTAHTMNHRSRILSNTLKTSAAESAETSPNSIPSLFVQFSKHHLSQGQAIDCLPHLLLNFEVRLWKVYVRRDVLLSYHSCRVTLTPMYIKPPLLVDSIFTRVHLSTPEFNSILGIGITPANLIGSLDSSTALVYRI